MNMAQIFQFSLVWTCGSWHWVWWQRVQYAKLGVNTCSLGLNRHFAALLRPKEYTYKLWKIIICAIKSMVVSRKDTATFYTSIYHCSLWYKESFNVFVVGFLLLYSGKSGYVVWVILSEEKTFICMLIWIFQFSQTVKMPTKWKC